MQGNVSEIVKTFHSNEIDDGEMRCLGNDCPDKNCRICLAADKAKFVLDVTDTYRASVEDGYYTTTIKEVYDPNKRKRYYVYVRPG